MSDNKKRILIFPCGSEIGLEVNRALANDIHFEMFGASSLPDHGKFVYKNYIEGVPFVDKENFIDEIEAICKKYKIDFIVPAHDSAVLKLAQNTDRLSAKLITSPVKTCEIARSKKETYKKLKDIIKCPKTYEISDKNIKYPVFVKPDVGQGSKGAQKVNNNSELLYAYQQNKEIVISEYLPGDEYTVDCFTNNKGELLFAQGRKRGRIYNGISVNSTPVYNPKLHEIAEIINSHFVFRGMWFFQVKENSHGEFVLMEFAPRIAGTMGMYRGLGINFIQLALYDAMGLDVKILKNKFNIEIDRALFACYKLDIQYDYVYIDFDDTILLNDIVNTDAMKFIYQAKNQNKKIILITKHSTNIYDTLQKYHISQDLFESIIHIDKNNEKSDYINQKNSIFIDDSYSERQKVSAKTGIPVFGIDAIEALFDYKK